jgi:AraC-like DNA-binding protein
MGRPEAECGTVPAIVVVVCVGCSPHWRVIARQCPAGIRVEQVASLDLVASALRRGDPIDVLLLSVDNLDRFAGAEAIRAATATAPGRPIIAVATPSAALPHLLIDGAHCGLTDVIVIGHDHVGAVLRSALSSIALRRDCLVAAQALADDLPEGPRRVIELCLTHGQARLSVDRLAHMLGVHRRTMSEWLQARNLPAAGELISWGRLVEATCRLSQPGTSVERVALDLGFASASGLHNMIRRYTGFTPTALRNGDGERMVLEALRRALHSPVVDTFAPPAT